MKLNTKPKHKKNLKYSKIYFVECRLKMRPLWKIYGRKMSKKLWNLQTF